MTTSTTYYQGDINLPGELIQVKATLKAKAQQVRSQYIRRGKPTSGNVAVAKLIISNNKIYEKEATSKAEPLNIPGQEGGPIKYFEPHYDTVGYPPYLNEAHAEYKVFNALTQALSEDELTLDVEGILYLYSERDMCPGCFISCEQDFKGNFPNIQIIIFSDIPHQPK
ncbi:hypothetical protein RIVM261_005830 [Rivularia sp. IAM M-261]|nr:hypothetical protein RIVM261_005830 [Rivularia sp. IAM M-261]